MQAFDQTLVLIDDLDVVERSEAGVQRRSVDNDFDVFTPGAGAELEDETNVEGGEVLEVDE